jgi:hypothetical protein
MFPSLSRWNDLSEEIIVVHVNEPWWQLYVTKLEEKVTQRYISLTILFEESVYPFVVSLTFLFATDIY